MNPEQEKAYELFKKQYAEAQRMRNYRLKNVSFQIYRETRNRLRIISRVTNETMKDIIHNAVLDYEKKAKRLLAENKRK